MSVRVREMEPFYDCRCEKQCWGVLFEGEVEIDARSKEKDYFLTNDPRLIAASNLIRGDE